MRFRAARPVFRKGDDTHIHRATTLRSQSLAPLAVRGRSPLLPARHVPGAVLGRVRSASTVPAAVAVVAVVCLALARRHRLGAAITPPPVAGVSCTVAVRHLTNNLTYT